MLVQGRMERTAGADYIRRMDPATHAISRLTAREHEVLSRTASGQTNAQIAAGLGVTIHAVKFHLSSIFRKLGVNNRTGAVAVFFAHDGTTS
jgi:DNA-binding CsgD family transcriptional regulator